MKPIHLAVVGATGMVGARVLELLAQRPFPWATLRLLASSRSAGQSVELGGTRQMIQRLEPDALSGVDLVIGSTPDEVAKQFAPWVVAAGGVLVDESAAHRMREDVPLVVPEVNPEAIDHHRGIVASPNCSTTQLVVALNPLHQAATLRRVIVTTFQATSGAGMAGRARLLDETKAWLDASADRSREGAWPAGETRGNDTPPDGDSPFTQPIAFNLIPQIGSFNPDGESSEETKMIRETRKILNLPELPMSATCVRVPVAHVHAESVVVELDRPLSAGEARELFDSAPGITVVDQEASPPYPMPITADGRDDVQVGRIRRDPSHPRSIAFWCVSDNLRKGAATNAVQIAQRLVERWK